jgi:hypothetical protein
MHEDLSKAGFPVPLRNGDWVTSDDRRLRAQAVDSGTRRLGETIIAYEFAAVG